MLKNAENIANATVNNEPLDEYQSAVVNHGDANRIRVLSTKQCSMKVYPGDAGSRGVNDWTAIGHTEVPPNEPVDISRPPRSTSDGVRVWVADHQLFDMDFGSTFVYDGQNMIKVHPRPGVRDHHAGSSSDTDAYIRSRD